MIAEAIFFLCGLTTGLLAAAYYAGRYRQLRERPAQPCQDRQEQINEELARQKRRRTMWD